MIKELNYNEAIKLAKELSEDLVKVDALREHCRQHELNYHNIVSFIRGDNRKAKQPKLIIDFLKSLGYSATVDKQIIYKFIVDSDEATNLSIEALIKK
ncbi:hypothetical protein [uncultured Flavobacterium sp.]|uniref:hypothetical protein n=1 Tax=uncultured Flavobacterium sp. TaxID=165435 RepID=UPI002597425A|nr:hypothetical protein [uncultured Flavobacterium sp.]